MSRMGKKPIQLISGADVKITDSAVEVSGPKGKMSFDLPEYVSVVQEENTLFVKCEPVTREQKAAYGMVRSMINNMVTGVTEGFRKELDFVGVGYRGQVQGKKLTLNLGYSHPIEFEVPEGLTATMPQPTRLVLEGYDKQVVGQAAATIRGFRPPEPYKGKGIRYVGEHIVMKEGKSVGK